MSLVKKVLLVSEKKGTMVSGNVIKDFMLFELRNRALSLVYGSEEELQFLMGELSYDYGEFDNPNE